MMAMARKDGLLDFHGALHGARGIAHVPFSVAIPSTARGRNGHFTVLPTGARSRIPYKLAESYLTGLLFCHTV
jgi:hypothetical protein